MEVELEINKIDSISESAVIGVPDKKWGQKVIAFIVPNGDSVPSLDEIEVRLKDSLRGFKVPKEFIQLESLPKTPLMKVKKGELLKIYLKSVSQT
jgi:acyl-CoA synthetase (AMP-forming)/AMP-acid ligase II